MEPDTRSPQESCFTVTGTPLAKIAVGPSAVPLPRLNRDFLCRLAMVAIFVLVAHQFAWNWLCFLTSEALLRISAFLGLAVARVSFDTLSVNGQLVQYVTSCTFIDVYLGSVPLLWNLRNTSLQNFSFLSATAIIFAALNIVRLETALVMFADGISWTVADGLLGGLAYFAIWRFIWRQRSWRLM